MLPQSSAFFVEANGFSGNSSLFRCQWPFSAMYTYIVFSDVNPLFQRSIAFSLKQSLVPKSIVLANANLLSRTNLIFQTPIVFLQPIDLSGADRFPDVSRFFRRQPSLFKPPTVSQTPNDFSEFAILFPEANRFFRRVVDKLRRQTGLFFSCYDASFYYNKMPDALQHHSGVFFFCETGQVFRFCFKTDRRYQKPYSCVHEIPG